MPLFVRLLPILMTATVACSGGGGGGGGGSLQPAGGWDFDIDELLDGSGADLPDGGASLPDVPAPDGPACTKSAACKDHEDTPYCAVQHGVCVECLIPLHCKETTNWCEGFKCVAVSCKGGATRCEGDFLQTCNATGDGWQTTICPDEAPVCVGSACALCTPGSDFCAQPAAFGEPSLQAMKCSADGQSASLAQECEGQQVCVGGQCRVCVAGQKRCTDQIAEVCAPDGDAWQVAMDCTAKNLSCVGGLCLSPCSSDIKSNSNVGCDYWAVDLDNAVDIGGGKTYDAQNAQFSVIVSNTSGAPATVHVSFGGGKDTPGAKTDVFVVQPNKLQVIDLPRKSWGLKNQNQEGSGINNRAFRIQSDQPVVAYQFNPLQNYDVFSNDASLLLPTNALGKVYRVMSRTQLGDKFRSYLTVVATVPGETTVQVKVTAKTLAGAGVAAMAKGELGVFKLKQGEVLNIESNEPNGDLTGSLVDASQPVAVFGGSEASNSPAIGNCVSGAPYETGKVCATTSAPLQKCTKDSDCGPTCCADHLEEQMFPLNTLGTTYVGAHLFRRGKEKDAWRVLAAQNGTTFTLEPSLGVVTPTLNQGEWFEFETASDFVLKATAPVLVGHYMASSYNTVTKISADCEVDSDCKNKHGFTAVCEKYTGDTGSYCAPIGDPSLLLNVATSQYLNDYVFLVPDQYTSNYINVIAAKGTLVQLDGQFQVPAWFETVPGSTWQVARLPIQPGPHRLQADKPVGLFVYGYDDDVSYGYPGGAGLGL